MFRPPGIENFYNQLSDWIFILAIPIRSTGSYHPRAKRGSRHPFGSDIEASKRLSSGSRFAILTAPSPNR